jgi:rod shape-determining protein MreC
MPLPIPADTRNRVLAVALLAFCAVCVAFPRPWHQSVRSTAQGIAHGPRRVLAASHNRLQALFGRLGALWRSAEEVERLRRENLALRQALARLADEHHQTNVRLRNFAQFDAFRQRARQRPLRIVPATVVAVDPSPWRHSVVIDRGAQAGLRIGAPAVYGTSIVGTVVALRPTAATVRLLTDSRFGLSARVVGTDEVGLLRGTSEPQARLAWIHLKPVAPGDAVVTSGLDPGVPPGLLVGHVAEASQTRTPLFFDILVRPDIDLDRLTELLVLVHPHDDVGELLEIEEEAAPPP